MESGSIIKVENVSKAYRIGMRDVIHDTLGSAVISWIKSPLRNLQQIKGLSKIDPSQNSLDIHWALRDINFEVKRGEVLGIIGKNGAGKSTLLKILCQITEPTTGEIEIRGRVASLLEVGTGFNPELSGRENVFLNGTILGMTKREISKKFDEIVSFSGVEKFIDTPVKRYSSGMKVRLAFAVAAHLEPEILIIDEVLAVGDAEFQKKCLGKVEEVSGKDGRTVLFVSHDMSAVARLSNSILVLDNGVIKFNGDKDLAVNMYLGDDRKELKEVVYKDETFSIEKFKIVNTEGAELDFVQTFQPFAFHIILASTMLFSEFRIEIILRNKYGVIIANLSNVLLQESIRLKEGVNEVWCSVPSFSLAPESYSIDIHIFPNKLNDKVIKIPGVGILSVINSEQTRIKQKFRSDWYGYVVIDHHWMVK